MFSRFSCALLLLASSLFSEPARRWSLAENSDRVVPGHTLPLRTASSERLAARDPDRPPVSTVHSRPEAANIGVFQDSEGRFVSVSPLTPPGVYVVDFSARDGDGAERAGVVEVHVDPIRSAEGPAVLLLNGWGLTCSPDRDSRTTFGQLEQLLERDGRRVEFFNNTQECCRCSMKKSATGLAPICVSSVLPSLTWSRTAWVIARRYLSVKQEQAGVFRPPIPHRVRKLVTIGTPHFGADPQGLALFASPERQLHLMQPGSRFIWDLATWNQGSDDLRAVDALAIAANGGLLSQGDGIVPLTSASLSGRQFSLPAERTRVVPYCHTDGPL